MSRNMSATDIDISSCANCGKGEEESNKLKTCSACLSVKYCSAECQKAHRPQHKKECKKRAAELYDEKLFTEVEPKECPICMLPMPQEANTSSFQSCCGKTVCAGCDYEMRISLSEGGDLLCPFCRMPRPGSYSEEIKRTRKLMDKGNGDAFYHLAGYYARGVTGLPQDDAKANELLHKAAELGCTNANYNLGQAYKEGIGVEVDKNKAKHYWELAAMGGDIMARNNLGWVEGIYGNHHRAMKHFLIAAKTGEKKALDNVKIGFMKGIVTKDDYANTLRAHQKSLNEMKSDARDKAICFFTSGGVDGNN